MVPSGGHGLGSLANHISELYIYGWNKIMVVPIHCLESFPFESDCQGSKFNILLFSLSSPNLHFPLVKWRVVS